MRLLGTVAVLLACLGACSSGGDDEDAADTTTTRAETSTSTTTEPSSTTAPSEPPVCEDPTGDAADPDGAKPASIPAGMDLTGAQLSLDENSLTVRITSEPAPPASTTEPTGLFWSIDAWTGEDGGYYQLRIALDGDTWNVEVFETSEVTNETLDITPTVRDGALTVAFPRESLPELDPPFTWDVITEWGDMQLFNDACPGGGSSFVEPEDQLTYPG